MTGPFETGQDPPSVPASDVSTAIGDRYAERMARIPGIDGAFGAARTAAAASLPIAQRVVQEATGRAVVTGVAVVNGVAGAVRGTKETATGARDTVQALHRLALRAERIADELEEPLLALRPGLVRLAEVLDDPTISEFPETLRHVQDDLLPVLRTMADTHEKVSTLAGSTDRILTFVDDTSRTISGLPGASLLGRRRPSGTTRAVLVEVEDSDSGTEPEAR